MYMCANRCGMAVVAGRSTGSLGSMSREFHFSTAVIAWLIGLGVVAIVLGVVVPPPFFIFLGWAGMFAMFVALFSTWLRMGLPYWRWREMVNLRFLFAEGLIGSSGAALMGAMFADAAIYAVQHAA